MYIEFLKSFNWSQHPSISYGLYCNTLVCTNLITFDIIINGKRFGEVTTWTFSPHTIFRFPIHSTSV